MSAKTLKKGRYTDQHLYSISVKKLKGIENLDNLTFSPHKVTAILGSNGIGKSSILHAIVSAFQPEKPELSENHRMSEYLKPNPHALWKSTELSLEISYKDAANRDTTTGEVKETKETVTISKHSERWTPRYDRRPYRPVFYIGIHTTLPLLEYINFIKNKSRIGSQNIKYTTTELVDGISIEVMKKCSYILNRDYSNIYIHQIDGWSESLYGLSYDGMTYSQLSMGAGEQRLIKILKTALSAEPNSIVAIDELDLLLHEEAFQRTIEVLAEHAEDKNIQIIFTTHRETVSKKSNSINIRYLHRLDGRTNFIEEMTPDAFSALTGEPKKAIRVYVEDKLSSRIIKKICAEESISKHIETIRFGTAKNCFTVIASAALNKNLDSIIGVIDGDEYRSEGEKRKQLSSVYAGSDRSAIEIREKTLDRIFQYNLPAGLSPEEYIKKCICSIERKDVPQDLIEIYDGLKSIKAVLNRHNYIRHILTHYDEVDEVIIKNIVDLFSLTNEWHSFTADIRSELVQIKKNLKL